MTTKTRSLGKLPTDVRARERLREAQAVEAAATTAVYAAHSTLAAATTKRDELLAAASESVAAADAALLASYAKLILVSGLDRTALLLGVAKSELRKAIKSESKNHAAAEVRGGGESVQASPVNDRLD